MPNDHIELLKRQLAAEIMNVASQTKAWRVARALGIDRARLSNLRRGRLERFSLEWLIEVLATLGRRVDLTLVVIGSPRVRWAALLRRRAISARTRPAKNQAGSTRHSRPVAHLSERKGAEAVARCDAAPDVVEPSPSQGTGTRFRDLVR